MGNFEKETYAAIPHPQAENLISVGNVRADHLGEALKVEAQSLQPAGLPEVNVRVEAVAFDVKVQQALQLLLGRRFSLLLLRLLWILLRILRRRRLALLCLPSLSFLFIFLPQFSLSLFAVFLLFRRGT